MYLMRVVLPDRPGSLGAVATALGASGADIQSVQIVQRGADLVVDDFLVDIPAGMLPDEVISACHALTGVEVLWISRSPAGSLVTDVEVLEQMLAEPTAAPEVLVQAAPRLLHASWAMVLIGTAGAALASANAPESPDAVRGAIGEHDEATQVDLPANWLPEWPETTVAVVPVPGDPDRCLLVGRPGGPAFFDSELARLRHLAGLMQPSPVSTGRTRETSTR